MIKNMSKETSIYCDGAIATGIDAAGDTADTYITAVDENGITVHPARSNWATNGGRTNINADGMTVYVGSDDVAFYGATARIGKSNSDRVTVDSTNGVAIYKGNSKRLQTTANGIDVYGSDGTENIVAQFGTDGARIGKLGAAHVEISQKAMTVSTGNFATDKRFVAGLANDPVTGLATVELFGVLDRVQIKSGVEYYAIEHGGIEPSSFTAIEIDGVSHSVTGLSYSDTAILLDKTEYAMYSRSVAKITYATEDPVPTMFYGTSLNVSGVNTGPNSAALGYTSSALGLASFAAGYNANAWGSYSAAIGQNSDAYGRNSAAFGYGTETGTKGTDSIALGYNAKTNAMFAVSAGTGVVAQNLEETVLGAYNDYESDVNPYGRTQYNNRGEYALVIGNGTADDARSNALTVGWDGTVTTARDILVTSTSGMSGIMTAASGITVDIFKFCQRSNVASILLRAKKSTATAANTAITVGTIVADRRPPFECAGPGTSGVGDCWIDEAGVVKFRSTSQIAANANFYVRVTYPVA